MASYKISKATISFCWCQPKFPTQKVKKGENPNLSYSLDVTMRFSGWDLYTIKRIQT